MKLLELYVSVSESSTSALDSPTCPDFTILAIAGESGGGEAPSRLPFWEDDGRDWRSTVLGTVELNSVFAPELFCQDGQQDWLLRQKLLSLDRSAFSPDWLEQIGQSLFKALFPPGSRPAKLFDGVLREAQQEETELHLRLKFSPDIARRSRLADYPWELLHDGDRFLLQRDIRLSRYLEYETVPRKVRPTEQLQVWLVSSRASDKELGLRPLPDDERQAIQASLQNAQGENAIALTTLPNGNFKALRDALARCEPSQHPQVLHFDGHGLYGQRCSNPACRRLHNSISRTHCQNPACGQPLPKPEGFLMFEGERGELDPVSAQQLAAVLRGVGVNLVVLSACESGMAVGGESLFNGAAQQLIDHRIPAVMAMQYAVTVPAAREFSERFYQVLGQRTPIIQAVSAGRQATLLVAKNQWYRPVLYLRSPCPEGGRLFCDIPLPPELDQLYGVLRPHQQQVSSAIDKAYRSIVPLSTELPSQLLRQKLRNVLQLPSIDTDVTNAVLFVLNLLKEAGLDLELQQQLKTWLIQQGEAAKQKLQQQETEARQSHPVVSALQSTLMIKVEVDPQDRKQYFVSAVLAQDSNPDVLEVEPFDRGSTTTLGPLSVKSLQGYQPWLESWVKLCIDQGISLRELAVECFLPTDLLHLGVDAEWTIELGEGESEKELLSTYCQSFVIRALNRHGPSSKYDLRKNDWKQSWQHLARHYTQPWQEYFVHGEGDFDDMLDEFLDQDGFTGWHFDLPAHPDDQQDLFEELLKEAIPVALWMRPVNAEIADSPDFPKDIEASSKALSYKEKRLF